MGGPIPDEERPDLDAFGAWLRPLPLHIVVSKDHGRWYAVTEDFGISGAGSSEQAAVENLGHVLTAYLHDYYDRGLSFEEALQPPPRSRRLLVPSVVDLARFTRRQLTRRLSFRRSFTLPLRSVLH